MAPFNAPPNALTPYLKSLELLERLPTPPAPTHGFARRRPELTPHLSLVRIAVGTLRGRPNAHELYEPAAGIRARRWRDPVCLELRARRRRDPIGRPCWRIRRLHPDIRDARGTERGDDVVLDHLNRRTSGICRRDRNGHRPIRVDGDIAHDAKLAHAEHRHLGVHHPVENGQHLIARGERASYHVAPGCDRAMICISASM